MKKILILKNDRVGDFITSIETINLILNKHHKDKVYIFLSKINYKFNFMFKNLETRIFNYNLNFLEKLFIFFFIYKNNITDVYILAPKNFYYYLPFIFRKIKFHAICIDSNKSRPNSFLKKYLFTTSTIYKKDKSKVQSWYKVQENLLNSTKKNKNFIKLDFKKFTKFDYPKNATYFHYKFNLFNEKLKWDLVNINKFILFLSSKRDYIVFSSELNSIKENQYFIDNFNSYDFKFNIFTKKNNRNILFLNNIEGKDLFNMIYLSKEVIAPESGITHIGSFLNKKTLALMHFNFKNKNEIFRQIIDCKEWAPRNFKFIILKRNFDQSILKIIKRI